MRAQRVAACAFSRRRQEISVVRIGGRDRAGPLLLNFGASDCDAPRMLLHFEFADAVVDRGVIV
jgi:hypothetical protein